MQSPSNEDAGGNAILQNFRVYTYNKSISLLISKQPTKNYPTLNVEYPKQQTENSLFGAKPSNPEE